MRRIWSYDLAREQSPSLETWRELCRFSLEAGYDGLAIYLEHRFAYASAPFVGAGGGDDGVLTPAIVRTLRREFPGLDLIPMLNLLGHMEGFFGTAGGAWIAEERFKGMSGCPCRPGFLEFCRGLLEDVLAAFDSPWIHLGGDETAQLGKCPECAARAKEVGKTGMYLEHFAPLIERVRGAGRTACLWADMALGEPTILDALPRDVVLFNWQYFDDPLPTTRQLRDSGFEVVVCPTVHSYNAAWVHLGPAVQNSEAALAAAEETGALGTCLTTWEGGLFGAYETWLPVIAELREPSGALERLTGTSSWEGAWRQKLGVELPDCGGVFGFSEWRSSVKCRLLLYGNPFLLWMRDGRFLLGSGGIRARRLAEEALALARMPSEKGVSNFVTTAIQFVELAERAAEAYTGGRPGEAVVALTPMRSLFDGLAASARAAVLNFGGSRADVERCRIAKEHVERVMRRIQTYGDGSLGYLPAFEAITHPRFVPYDQANWWRVNDWADE